MTHYSEGQPELTSRHFSLSLRLPACHIYLEGTGEGHCWRGDCVRPTKWQLQLTATDGTPRLQSNPPHAAAMHHAITVGNRIK